MTFLLFLQRHSFLQTKNHLRGSRPLQPADEHMFQEFFIAMPKATPMNKADCDAQPWTRLYAWLLFDCLCTLERIHDEGYVHSQVVPRNILFLFRPLRATLSGLDKLYQIENPGQHEIDARELEYAAPETIDRRDQNATVDPAYAQDEWQLGLSYGHWLHGDCFEDDLETGEVRQLKANDAEDSRLIEQKLWHRAAEGKAPLASLIRRLLRRDPAQRPTASEALHDPISDFIKRDRENRSRRNPPKVCGLQ